MKLIKSILTIAMLTATVGVSICKATDHTAHCHADNTCFSIGSVHNGYICVGNASLANAHWEKLPF